ncbi:hypothetical protein Efla_001933 [Eimeria flavescens]
MYVPSAWTKGAPYETASGQWASTGGGQIPHERLESNSGTHVPRPRREEGKASGPTLPEWRDPPQQVKVTAATPCCASMSLHSKEGVNVFVTVTIAGTTVLALVDTGSARTLLDASIFTPNRLRGFSSSARSEDELLLDASGNQIPIVGVWESWITCSGQADCILVDVVKGKPTKAVLGLDSFRSLMLAVVYSGASFELRAGGMQMTEIDSIRLCATEDHPSVRSVNLRQGLYDTDRRQSNLRSSLSIDWHYEARARL